MVEPIKWIALSLLLMMVIIELILAKLTEEKDDDTNGKVNKRRSRKNTKSK